MMPMKMRKLITTKPHKYGTRHLTAGEEYEVPPRHAIALVAGKKAKFADDKKSARAARVDEALVPDSDNSIAGPATHGVGAMTSDAAIDRLRLEATQLGIDVDRRWGMVRLQHEIAQAKR
jgi:hypothetical protein